MTKRDFAEELYVKLSQHHNIQEIVDSIQSATKNNESLSITEQLEIVNLIRDIHIKQSRGIFESVDAFLDLVAKVETQIKSQSESISGNGASQKNDTNK